jgi:hypothetical protein
MHEAQQAEAAAAGAAARRMHSASAALDGCAQMREAAQAAEAGDGRRLGYLLMSRSRRRPQWSQWCHWGTGGAQADVEMVCRMHRPVYCGSVWARCVCSDGTAQAQRSAARHAMPGS